MSYWPQQFEIIKKKISLVLEKSGKNLSQQQMADLLGVSKGKIQAWEKGQRPSADDLEKVGEVLCLRADWLLFGKGGPGPDLGTPIMGISVPAEIPAKPNGGCRESHANYYEKYCDERDRAVRAEREVNRVEREALHAERRADELKRRLVDQQERILHSVMVELKNEKVDPEVIARVHAAIVDYSSTAGTCDTCGRPVTEPGDTGARLPQPERP